MPVTTLCANSAIPVTTLVPIGVVNPNQPNMMRPFNTGSRTPSSTDLTSSGHSGINNPSPCSLAATLGMDEATFHQIVANRNCSRPGSQRGSSPPPQPPPSASSSPAGSRSSLGMLGSPMSSSTASMGSLPPYHMNGAAAAAAAVSSSSVESAPSSPLRFGAGALPMLNVPPPPLETCRHYKKRSPKYHSEAMTLHHQMRSHRLNTLLAPDEHEQVNVPVSSAEHIRCLEGVLHRQGCFETDKGLQVRKDVLKDLNNFVRQWIQSISLSRGMHWQDVDKVGGRIVTYGSYMLGISHQGADIDALCVAPQHVTREDYFSSFYNLLGMQSDVTELRSIQEAYVPVIKMKYNGIEIDMTFARLNTSEVPPAARASDNEDMDTILPSIKDLVHLDPKCVRSLNGYRSTLEIKRLVPNLEAFRLALRAIKLWAKSQGLYSNILGYLGGFSWAVLVANVCMLNPDSNAMEVIQKFFHLYGHWEWPKPVTLVDLDKSSFEHQTMGLSTFYSSWNPEYNIPDRLQVMPIITPTYPHINSSFNVSGNTKKLIQQKMLVAAGTCDRIMEGKESWDSLFKTCHMFHEYEHFLVVMASASKHLMWFGLIESKIRHLVNSIEKDCSATVSSARIWPKPYSRTKKTETTITAKQLWFIGLEFYTTVNRDFKRILHCFELQLKQQARSFLTPDMNIEGHFVLKSELTSLLTPSEIQGIVSSQSQKKGNVATVITPQQTAPDHHHHPYPLSSALLTSTPLQPHADELTHQLLNSLPTYANATKSQGAKPNLPNYYGSPTGSSSSATPNYVNTPLGLPTHTKTPIMERTWHTSNHRRGSNRHRRNQTLSPGSNHSNSPQVDGAGNGGVDLLNLIVKSDDSPRHLLSSVGSDESSPNSCQDHNSNALKSRYNSHSSGSCSSAVDDGSNSSLESDHGRSVSFSSDKFPPTALIQARIHHSDSMNFSIPPPTVPSSTTNGEPARLCSKDLKKSANGSQQRLSSGEICDVPTPAPVQSVQYPPLRFNFNSSSLQQLQAASDSVFH